MVTIATKYISEITRLCVMWNIKRYELYLAKKREKSSQKKKKRREGERKVVRCAREHLISNIFVLHSIIVILKITFLFLRIPSCGIKNNLHIKYYFNQLNFYWCN